MLLVEVRQVRIIKGSYRKILCKKEEFKLGAMLNREPVWLLEDRSGQNGSGCILIFIVEGREDQ